MPLQPINLIIWPLYVAIIKWYHRVGHCLHHQQLVKHILQVMLHMSQNKLDEQATRGAKQQTLTNHCQLSSDAYDQLFPALLPKAKLTTTFSITFQQERLIYKLACHPSFIWSCPMLYIKEPFAISFVLDTVEWHRHAFKLCLWETHDSTHAFSCFFGSFPTITHSELCGITAALLSEVYHNV